MPRLYSENPDHENDWAEVKFHEGAAAVNADEDVSYFEDNTDLYTIDTSKHKLEVWDSLDTEQLDELYEYLGGTVVTSDSKYQKVRKIETSLSGKYIAEIISASAAATTGTGKTKITITSPGTQDYYFMSAKTTAPSLLYGDVPSSSWQKLTLVAGVADEIVPNAATDDKYAVVTVSNKGTVTGIDDGTLTVKS